jgi:hypothetical protein
MIQPPNDGQFRGSNFGSKPPQSRGGTAPTGAPNQDTPGSRIANGAFPYTREASGVEGNRMIPGGYRGARTETRATDTPPARGVEVEGGTEPPGILGTAR